MNLPILMYHKIELQADTGTDLAVTVDAFQAQVRWLKRHGYQSLSLASLGEAVSAGRKIPRLSVVITFDDAYASVWERARPILEASGLTATVFAVAKAEGGHNFWDQGKAVPRTACMTADQLRQLAGLGWEIGSHGLTHVSLNELDPAGLRFELEESKRILAQQTGRPIVVFSYPYGGWNPMVRAAVQAAGYVAAAAISPGTRSVTADLFALRRVYVKPCDTLRDFRRKISGWYLTFRAWRKR